MRVVVQLSLVEGVVYKGSQCIIMKPVAGSQGDRHGTRRLAGRDMGLALTQLVAMFLMAARLFGVFGHKQRMVRLCPYVGGSSA